MPKTVSLQDQLVVVTKQALKLRGWSQAELARQLGISTKHVSLLLTGHSQGRLTMWDRIFKVLKIKVDVVPK